MNELHVSGVLVRSRPEAIGRTRERLESLQGVEVYTTTPEGHIVTIVERETSAALADAFTEIQNSTTSTAANNFLCSSDLNHCLGSKI